MISSFISIQYIKKNQLYHSFSFFLLFFPLLIFLYFLFRLSFYEQSFFFCLGFSISSYFSIAIFQFIFYKKNLLNYFHHRFFYHLCIIIYLYILVLLNIRKVPISTTTTISFESVLILIFFLIFLFVTSFIPKKNIKQYKIAEFIIPFLMMNISLFALFLIAISGPSSIILVLLIYTPIYYYCFLLIKKCEFNRFFLNSFTVSISSLLFFAVIDFLFFNLPIYTFVSKEIFLKLQNSLYVVTIFLIPLVIKLPKFFNYLWSLLILILSIYLFLT